MKKSKIFLCIFLSLIPSSRLKNVFYRSLLGWNIGKNVKIGFSLITVENVKIANNVRINHLNVFKGFSDLNMGTGISVGRNNRFFTNPVYSKGSLLQIGNNCTITSSHIFDLTDSIILGN